MGVVDWQGGKGMVMCWCLGLCSLWVGVWGVVGGWYNDCERVVVSAVMDGGSWLALCV